MIFIAMKGTPCCCLEFNGHFYHGGLIANSDRNREPRVLFAVRSRMLLYEK